MSREELTRKQHNELNKSHDAAIRQLEFDGKISVTEGNYLKKHFDKRRVENEELKKFKDDVINMQKECYGDGVRTHMRLHTICRLN